MTITYPASLFIQKLISYTKKKFTFFTINKEEIMSTPYSVLECQIIDLLNEHRIQKDLSPLKILDAVFLEAMQHNYYMIQNEELSHDNFSMRYKYLSDNIEAKNVQENIAHGYKKAKDVVTFWLNNYNDKENIENPDFNNFGISCKKDNNGKYYFTSIFIEV